MRTNGSRAALVFLFIGMHLIAESTLAEGNSAKRNDRGGDPYQAEIFSALDKLASSDPEYNQKVGLITSKLDINMEEVPDDLRSPESRNRQKLAIQEINQGTSCSANPTKPAFSKFIKEANILVFSRTSDKPMVLKIDRRAWDLTTDKVKKVHELYALLYAMGVPADKIDDKIYDRLCYPISSKIPAIQVQPAGKQPPVSKDAGAQ